MSARKPTAVIAALTMLLTLVVAPVSAAPPESSDEAIFSIFPDLTYGLAVFWNITRDDYCAWEESGFAGAPPVDHLVTATFNQVHNDPIVLRWGDTSILELWALDEDAALTGPCEDTDESTEPWATGAARANNNDNDLEVSLTRTNSFGGGGQGTVWDADGDAWHYSWLGRALIDRADAFRIAADHTQLVQR